MMVGVYDYEIWCHKWRVIKPFLSENACFSISFNNKSKACGWNDAKCLFMCYFTCQAPKSPFIVVLTWFLILGKIQGGGRDGDHCWWRKRPPAEPPPILLRRSEAFHCRQNRFQMLKRGSLKPPHPHPPIHTHKGLYHGRRGGRVWICVYVRGLIPTRQSWKIAFNLVFFS